MIYPLVEYAHKIGKNTADFTTKDMAQFTSWWMKQPNKEDVIAKIKSQQQRAKQIKEGNNNMSRKHTTASFQAAQTSRLADLGIESPINDGEEEIVLLDETVCDMSLTKTDVVDLIWGLETLLKEYDLDGHRIGTTFKSLLQGLKEV